MKLVQIDRIPEKRWDKTTRKNLKKILTDFELSEANVARIDVDPYEYASPESLCESVSQAINRTEYSMKVYKRGTTVYIKKEVL